MPTLPPKDADDEERRALGWITQIVDEKARDVQAKLAIDLEQRVNDQLDRDRTFIKDVLAAALKVAGAGLVLVFFILGALTWTTYKNIHDSVIAAAKSGVEKQLKDPETKRTVDGIVDRGLLDAFLLRIARHDIRKDSEARLAETDLDVARIVKLMTNKDTDRATFESAAEVLIRVCPTQLGDETNDLRADAILNACASIIRATDKGFEWAAERTERRLWLLRRLKQAELANDQTRAAARELLSMQGMIKPELRRAAILYAGAIHDTDSLEVIRALFNDPKNEEFRADSIEAIVRLKPDVPEVAKWCTQILEESQPTIRTLGTAFEISEQVDSKLGERLIDFVSRKTSLNANRRNFDELILRAIERPKGRIQTISVSKKPIFDGDNESAAVLKLLQKFSAESDVVELARFVRWLSPVRGILFQVKAQLNGDGAVRLEDNTSVTKSVAPRGLLFSTRLERVVNGKAVSILLGTWSDPNDPQKSISQKIVQIINPQQVNWSVLEQKAESISDIE